MNLIDCLRCTDDASEECIRERKCKYVRIDRPGWAQVPCWYYCDVHQMMCDAADELEGHGDDGETN